MTDTGKDRSGRNQDPLYSWSSRLGRHRFLLYLAILASIVGAYAIGLVWARWDIEDDKRLISELQADNQKLKKEIADQAAVLVGLQTKLKTVQAAYEEIMPSENTYRISPNQSLIIAKGHLTIGLIGSPSNQRIDININGKQQSATTGDVIDIALDPTKTCQVRVQSFDMFKAIIAASCTGL